MHIGKLPASILDQYLNGGVSFPVVVYGGHDDEGRVHALGGLGWFDGRCVGFIDVFTDISSRSLTLVRWAKRVLKVAKQLGETEVYIFRDEWHENSAKLIGLLGFEMVGVMLVGDDPPKEIYLCRV